MQMSRRARRMERHHKRLSRRATINLVSLMDIFTILVFFLLVNSSEVNVLPSTKTIELPESIAEQRPKETLFIIVSEKDLIVQGRPVATIEEALAGDGEIIEPLRKELEYRASRSPLPAEVEARREITILGDKNIPYKLLKRIMVTCNSVDYSDIKLAVARKTNEG